MNAWPPKGSIPAKVAFNDGGDLCRATWRDGRSVELWARDMQTAVKSASAFAPDPTVTIQPLPVWVAELRERHKHV